MFVLRRALCRCRTSSNISQRPQTDEAAAQSHGSADQHGSRGSGRSSVRLQPGAEGDGGREQLAAGAQPRDPSAAQLSAEDAEWEDWKAVRPVVCELLRSACVIQTVGFSMNWRPRLLPGTIPAVASPPAGVAGSPILQCRTAHVTARS